jgi:hypothetical protein
MIEKYLNIQHNYEDSNCLALICRFYEEELGIKWEEERRLFNNFKITDFKDLRKVPVENVFTLKNWLKINLTFVREFDIIVYTREKRLSHFAMYVGDYKVLDLVENQKSVLRHFNDNKRNNIEGCIRHRQLATKLPKLTL